MPKQNHTIHFIIVYIPVVYPFIFIVIIMFAVTSYQVMPYDERDIKSHKVKTILLYEINSIDEESRNQFTTTTVVPSHSISMSSQLRHK